MFAARQSMLFSATQTTAIADLAKVSLKDPLFVAVEDKVHYELYEFTRVDLE